MFGEKVKGALQAGEHAESEHIDFHEPQEVDVILVPFDHLRSIKVACSIGTGSRGVKLRSALTVLGIAVGVAAQASAVQCSPDQQNGATPEERSRMGENHAINSE